MPDKTQGRRTGKIFAFYFENKNQFMDEIKET